MFLTLDVFHYLMDNPLFTMILDYMFVALDTFTVSYLFDLETDEIYGAYVGCEQVGLTICGEPVPQSLIDFRF